MPSMPYMSVSSQARLWALLIQSLAGPIDGLWPLNCFVF